MLMWLKGRAYLFSSRGERVSETLLREERFAPHTNCFMLMTEVLRYICRYIFFFLNTFSGLIYICRLLNISAF